MRFSCFRVIPVAFVLAPSFGGDWLQAAEPQRGDVFVGGQDGYACYRIPSLIATPKGTLLAFCEGRKFNGMDESPTDMVLKRSVDGGKTWSALVDCPALPEPVCQGSVLRYTWADSQGKSRILFANPGNARGRDHGTVRLSYDEGATWPVAKTIQPGYFGYSCLAVLPDWTICCLFENDGCNKATFLRFSLDWLTAGKDRMP